MGFLLSCFSCIFITFMFKIEGFLSKEFLGRKAKAGNKEKLWNPNRLIEPGKIPAKYQRL
ncbi:hypothetical protein EO95_16255 [Methanosarcina sp. 1.H.T.1A.1]|nr:hypothetical protein EO95_16255 [Methanosarcina sp. 1.H.T.1A.1]